MGKMPGGRFKTDGGPNDRELETAMLIEQAVMPLFPVGFTDNVQVRYPQHRTLVMCHFMSCHVISHTSMHANLV